MTCQKKKIPPPPSEFADFLRRYSEKEILGAMPVPVTSRAVRFWRSGERTPTAAMQAFMRREIEDKLGKREE